MDWLRENYFWVIVGVAFLWVHMKMHGGHGHGGHGHGGGGASDGHGRHRHEGNGSGGRGHDSGDVHQGRTDSEEHQLKGEDK